MSLQRGLFITLEGPEGGGKTSQAKVLIDRMNKCGHRAVYSHEPGGTPLGEKIRSLLIDPGNTICDLAELLLFEASRVQHVKEFIIPNLEKGISVVCDRFCDSSLAYQGARSLPLDWVIKLNDMCVSGCWPDITLLLDLDYDTGCRRLFKRYEGDKISFDRIEREDRRFFEALRQNYLEMYEQDRGRFSDPDQSRWRFVDASKSFDEISDEVWKHVENRLK